MSNYQLSNIILQLKSHDDNERINAVEALGKIRSPEVLDLLLEVATKGKADVKFYAREIFNSIGKLPEFKVPLLKMITSTDSVTKKEIIAESLQFHNDLQTVNTLILIHERHPGNINLEESAAWALAIYDLDRAREYFRKEKVDIVMAEDERDIRDLICFTLRFAGWSVMPARNGIAAYTFTKLCEPRLVLLDVRMPRMTGYEVCKQIKTDSNTSQIPVVFLSAKGQENEIQQGLDVGGDEYLLKPFAPDQLTVNIKRILRKHDLGIYDE